MSLYLLCVLFSYYILKPVSQSLFLNKFSAERLPYLYIFIAGAGGVLAYSYTKLAIRTSLKTAVTATTFIVILCLFGFWLLLEPVDVPPTRPWAYYAFNIWVSLFSIVLVSQGWLVAANVFNAREAKRLYGILGVGAVLGAAFGGSFTALAVDWIGTKNLMLASAAVVALAYLCFRLTLLQKGVSLSGVRAVEDETMEFSILDIVGAVTRYRHLQVMIAIITITYVVDVMVEYQFSAVAKQRFTGDELTAFLGSFRGLYVNLATIVLQLFVTSAVVNRFGVGGTLQIMPASLAIASLGTAISPGLFALGAARLAEAAGRYSFNRTGMELLYLPLPAELKNRAKAFVDIFVDRAARGLGGALLILLTGVLDLTIHQIAVVVIGLTGIWILLVQRARHEYVLTVRKRLEARRLDLESARITVNDPVTIQLLEQTAKSAIPRQAVYALRLLAESPGYRMEKQYLQHVQHPNPEVRGKVFELARMTRFEGLLPQAMEELNKASAGENLAAIKPAVAYALTFSPKRSELAQQLLDHPCDLAAQGALETIAADPSLAPDLVSHEWIVAAADSPSPGRRVLAAIALRVRTDEKPQRLIRLLLDTNPRVIRAACITAGILRQREHVDLLVGHLVDPRLRGAAIEALSNYKSRILGTLEDVLSDSNAPFAVRRQIPRVLQAIPDQRSVDVLLRGIALPDLTLRATILRALNRMRESYPHLSYSDESLTAQILSEARHYFELNAALAPFKEHRHPKSVARLLSITLEERLERTIERLFALLGLRYPPKEIDAAWRAVNRGREEELAAAIEFLDNVLDRELKKFLLPLFDASEHLLFRGEELFGVERKDAEGALRELLGSGDEWLVVCAIATAAELNLHSLKKDIEALSSGAGAEVSRVARRAMLQLA